VQLKGQGEMDTRSLAAELIRRRAILLEHAQTVERLRERVAGFERRYGIPSNEIHAAIEQGRLDETEEVCDWILDYELVRAAEPPSSRQPPRLD